MLNYLWAGMIVIGVIVGAFTGNLGNVTNAAISSAEDAVKLCITMFGVLSMWTGLMSIAEKSGLIDLLSRKFTPLLRFLFPEVTKDSKALNYISTNMIANILGLGWAATPAGIKAMEEMQKENPHKDKASHSMCMFMIINMSSLQLVSMNILAYRQQYGSVNPSEIIGAGIFATLITTIGGIIFAKICEKVTKP